MKKFLSVLLILVCLFGCIACAKTVEENNPVEDTSEDETEEEEETIDINTLMPVAVFTMENRDTFEVELYKEVAPKTVANFVNLVNSGFYNGTLIHRITFSGIFVIQGGGYFLDEDNEQYQKSATSIDGEFTSNGFTNNLSHEEGVISMARVGGSNNSATSQFFICYADSSQIDGDYATFGRIRKGLDIVKEIATVTCVGESPSEVIIIETVKIKYVQV